VIADYRDLVIQQLSDDEAALLGRVVHLETDVATYRELLSAAFDALHDVTVSLDRERAQHHEIIAEFRSFRELMLFQVGVPV
jgi:hypothetical protein